MFPIIAVRQNNYYQDKLGRGLVLDKAAINLSADGRLVINQQSGQASLGSRDGSAQSSRSSTNDSHLVLFV